jgi:hypothetical protein
MVIFNALVLAIIFIIIGKIVISGPQPSLEDSIPL